MSSKHVQKISNIVEELETYKNIGRKTILFNHIRQRLDESLKRYDEDLSETINILSLENQIKLARKLVEWR